MPDLLNELKKNKVIVTNDGEIYKLSGDYSDVQTKLDFEFQHLENEADTLMLSAFEVHSKLQNGWKIVQINE